MKLILSLGAVIIFLFVFSASRNNANTKNINYEPVDNVLDELVIGSKDAPVTLIEYADFKCPSCNQFHQTTAKELHKSYVKTGVLKIVFRPLALIGPDSRRAAYGAYCADRQNKFTDYHDAVYDYLWRTYYSVGNIKAEFEDVLSTKILGDLSHKAGLNSKLLTECLDNISFAQKIEQTTDRALKDGVRGTPTFKIGNKLVVGPKSFNTFKTLIEIEAKK